MAKKGTKATTRAPAAATVRVGLTVNGRLLHEVTLHHRSTVAIEGVIDPDAGGAADWYDEMALQMTVTPHFDADEDR